MHSIFWKNVNISWYFPLFRTMFLITLFSQYMGKINVPCCLYKNGHWRRSGLPIFTLFPVSIEIINIYLIWKISYDKNEPPGAAHHCNSMTLSYFRGGFKVRSACCSVFFIIRFELFLPTAFYSIIVLMNKAFSALSSWLYYCVHFIWRIAAISVLSLLLCKHNSIELNACSALSSLSTIIVTGHFKEKN